MTIEDLKGYISRRIARTGELIDSEVKSGDSEEDLLAWKVRKAELYIIWDMINEDYDKV